MTNESQNPQSDTMAKWASVGLALVIATSSAVFWVAKAQSKELIAKSEQRVIAKVDGLKDELIEHEREYVKDQTLNDSRDNRLNEILERLAQNAEQQQKIIDNLIDHDKDKARDISDIAKDVSETRSRVHGLSTQFGKLQKQLDKLLMQFDG